MIVFALQVAYNKQVKMFAKVLIICVAFAASHASLIAPVRYGAPILTAAPLHAAVPAVATVSSQRTSINHVAPSARVAVASVPVAHAGHGILANRFVGGHGIAAAPLAIGSGIYGAPVAHGVGYLGLRHGAAVSSQRSVINHAAPAAPVAVASVPVAHASHGILTNRFLGGHGLAAPLAVGSGVYGVPVAHGADYLGLGHGLAVSSQRSVINHAAPVAPVAVAAPIALNSHGIYGNGVFSSELVGGHGVAVSPLAVGHGLHGAPVALGHGAAVSSQSSVISHEAPAARVAVAAVPVALANTGYLRNGLVGSHGIVAGSPLGIAGHEISAHHW